MKRKEKLTLVPCDQHVALGQSGHHNSAIIFYQPPRTPPEEVNRLLHTIVKAQQELIELYQDKS